VIVPGPGPSCERLHQPCRRPGVGVGLPHRAELARHVEQLARPVARVLAIGHDRQRDQRRPEIHGPVVDPLALQEPRGVVVRAQDALDLRETGQPTRLA
jgi:hypothetical protein